MLLVKPSIINGQNNKIEWGPQLKKKGSMKILAVEEDNIYAIRRNTSAFTEYLNFVTIDKSSMKEVKKSTIPIEFLTLPLDFSIDNGKLQVLAVRKGKSFRKLIFDYDMNELSNELIMELDKSFHSPKIIMKGSSKIDLISTFRSPDKSKVGVMLINGGKKKRRVDLFVFDLKNELQLLSHKTLKRSSESEREKIADVELLNNGSINVLTKRYKDGKKEERDDQPNYDFGVCKLAIDAEQINIDLPKQLEYWKKPEIKSCPNGDMLVVGMTLRDPEKWPNGYQIIKLSAENEILYDEFYPMKFADSKKDSNGAFLSNIVILENNNFVLLTEIAWSITYFNMNGPQKKDRHFNLGMQIDSYGEDGSKLWSEKIYRDSYEKSFTKLFSDFLVYKHPAGLTLYYNTTEKNARPFNKAKQKEDKIPSTKSIIVAAHISAEGELSFEPLSQGEGMNITTNSSFSFEGYIYFAGAEGSKMKKMQIGRMAY